MRFLYPLASSPFFYRFAGKCLPWLYVAMILLFGYGLIGGLYLAPPDYQQGDAFRIIYIHVPSAFLSMMVYVVMALAAIVSWVWQIKLADVIVESSGPIGAWFTALALITGSIWGKPTWGTYWIWDARLTSELILLFLYWGVMALRQAIPDPEKAARASHILLFVGLVNIPIIHFSVYWWNTLHQGDTLSLFSKPKIADSMLWPLLAMIYAFVFYYMTVLLLRARAEIIKRERKSEWVKKIGG